MRLDVDNSYGVHTEMAALGCSYGCRPCQMPVRFKHCNVLSHQLLRLPQA